MQVIIPMSGRGDRFQRAGYQEIKPLIPVNGKPMIEHVISLFPGEENFLFICANDHLKTTSLEMTLRRAKRKSKIVGIAPHKKGPVFSVLEAIEGVNEDEPVIVSYCDFFMNWDYSRFLKMVRDSKCDGCIPSYKGFHPHSLGPNYYGYLRMEGDRVCEIREKGSFTENKMGEFASAGVYYFRTGKIMKQYFRLAFEKGLSVQGEFFASLPYNLMIEAGLDVRVFEVEHFLQWGTPEDLEEYQSWEKYFQKLHGSSVATIQSPGTLLIPMAGEGKRFRDAGYQVSKPLILVDGVPMLGRTLSSLPHFEETVAVCLKQDEKNPVLQAVGDRFSQNFRLLSVPGKTEGALCTTLLAKGAVDSKKPLMIAACDAALFFDGGTFKCLSEDSDFLVWTFKNHPHANRNPSQYAWVETSESGKITKLSCKVPLSKEPKKDLGVTGAFWFKSAELFWKAAESVLSKGEKSGGEFHVDGVINELLHMGKRGRAVPVSPFICLGTPDDLSTFEYWNEYFESGKVRNRGGFQWAA